MCYCGSVSDHLGPSALINVIRFDLIDQSNYSTGILYLFGQRSLVL